MEDAVLDEDERVARRISHAAALLDVQLARAHEIGHPDLVAKCLRKRDAMHRRAAKALAAVGSSAAARAAAEAKLDAMRQKSSATKSRNAAVAAELDAEKSRRAALAAAAAPAATSAASVSTGAAEMSTTAGGTEADKGLSAASMLWRHAMAATMAQAGVGAPLSSDSTVAGAAAGAPALAPLPPPASPFVSLLKRAQNDAKKLTKTQVAAERARLREEKRREAVEQRKLKAQREATHAMAWEARRHGVMLVRGA